MIQHPYFYTFNQYLRDTFPFKVYKIPIDAGFTCPNWDGTKAHGGCTYCSNESFSPGSRGNRVPIREQIQRGIDFYREKRKAKKFIVYFQAYSNTYAPVATLKSLYDEATSIPDVIGLSIGTRPDCIDEEKIELISSYRDKGLTVWVEYGLESMNNETLARINRADTFEDFQRAVEITKPKKLPICAHMILGLPGDTYPMMIESAKVLAGMDLQGIKIHHLYVAPKTVMAQQYQRGEIPVMSLDEYIPLLCDFLELLPPKMVIQRLMGELFGEYCIAPNWGLTKAQVIERIEKEFQNRGTRQGSKYSYQPSAIRRQPTADSHFYV